jgi:hypothetical protein
VKNYYNEFSPRKLSQACFLAGLQWRVHSSRQAAGLGLEA